MYCVYSALLGSPQMCTVCQPLPPQVLREGTTVTKHIADEGNKKSVIITVKSDSDEAVIVDLCTREPSTVRTILVHVCHSGHCRNYLGVGMRTF